MSSLCSWAVALKLCFVQNNIVHFSLPYNVESNEPARNIDTLGDAVMVVVGLRTVQTELLALFEVFEFIREKKMCLFLLNEDHALYTLLWFISQIHFLSTKSV